MRIARFQVGDAAPRWGRLQGDRILPWTAAPWDGGTEGTGHVALSDARLLAPVVPGKVLGVGLNYADHRADEHGSDATLRSIISRNLQNAPPDKEPILFFKAPSAVVGPGDPIRLPPGVGRVDYEAELVVVVGRRLYRPASPQEAAGAIFGYTAGNDVSARDVQNRDVQWTRAKSFDTFCPLGPWIETDMDASDARIQGLLNGEVRQDARTSQLIANPAQLLWFAAQAMTLLPGDVLMTGTPSGLGGVQPGDEFTVRIEGLGGDLRNPVAALDAGAR